MTGFTPQFELWSTLVAIAIFGVAIYLARATRRRAAGALLAALVFTGLNVPWDWMAHEAGWWWYPGQAGSLAPLLVYLAQDLVWGGAFGLLGWRIERCFGSRSLAVFVLLLSVIGSVRDSVIASVTGIIAFGSGPLPRLADFACWATLLVSAQGAMRLVAGPSACDGLAKARTVLGR